MKTVSDLLRETDPLRHEPHPLAEARDRLRRAVVAAASDVKAPLSTWFRTPIAFLATVSLVVIAIAGVGLHIWSQGGATLQAAAVRFEVRLAQDSPTAGLREARISGSDRVVYLHQEIIVTNSDIAQSRVVQGDGPSRFGVETEFNAAGAQKMRQATANHIGKPVAVLIDGEVVTVPVLRSPISTLGVISGDYTRAEAERIVNGIGIR
jgi:preprotein translocase subunit SecD